MATADDTLGIMSEAWEKRVHARIHVSATIQVDGGAIKGDAQLKDLSFGGARFETSQKVGEIGESVQLLLPGPGGCEIEIVGEIARIEAAPEGKSLVGVRFTDATPEMRGTLNHLIETLLEKRGSSERAFPRVSRRMDIQYGDLSELKAILEDISLGGLAMTVADPLAFQEQIDVTVPDTAGDQLLVLRAKVVHQHAVKAESGVTAYRVGLEFAPMRPETRRCLTELLRVVLDGAS